MILFRDSILCFGPEGRALVLIDCGESVVEFERMGKPLVGTSL